MDYTIYHNDHAVCTVNVNDNYRIDKIRKVHNRDHLPVGLEGKSGIDTFDLNEWLVYRAIPDKRFGLSAILEKEKVKTNRELLIKNMGLGLSDHYWIKTDKEGRGWKEVNFFENPFGDKGDDVYIGERVAGGQRSPSPNGASSGMLPKKWIIKDGRRYLLKGGGRIFNQEPYNEEIVSEFMDKLKVDHVKYVTALYKGKQYSLCENMLDNQNELVQAWYVRSIQKQRNNVSNYEHYIQCCKLMGLDDTIRGEIDKMILIDYLVANTDRHWMNFGIVRNAETLAGVGLAPLYDNGTSFYSDVAEREIFDSNRNLECKSFRSTQEDNIKLVKDFSWLEKNKKTVRELSSLVDTGLRKNEGVSEYRRNVIVSGITERGVMLGRRSGIDFSAKDERHEKKTNYRGI